MTNKYLVIPNKKEVKKVSNVDFLFPLKGFCVGMNVEFLIKELEDGVYVYINRILDSNSILELKECFIKGKDKIKGVVFEDLGVLTLINELNLNVEKILYATHALCGANTINAYLKYVDTVIISSDITYEETEEILRLAQKNLIVYVYGPLFYMYSRRTLLTNYQKNFALENNKILVLLEPITKQKFFVVESDYGTVFMDEAMYDGRRLLNHDNVAKYLINLSWLQGDIEEFMESFETKELPNTTSGFLDKKTIYRLPPRKEEK